MKKHINKFNLRYNKVNSKEARIAVMKGRPCLSTFKLDKKEWYNFKQFFKENPKGILTKKILEKPNNEPINSNKTGHAVY